MNLSKLSDLDLQQYKKKLEAEISKYKNFQKAKKISLNSIYGATGNEHFRFYDSRLAESITLSGQLVIRWLEKYLNEYLNSLLKTIDIDYVIAGDTDSCYLTLNEVVIRTIKNPKDKEKVVNFLDKFCETKLQRVVEKACEDLADYTNAYKQRIIMKRESIADVGIWTAKKRYILNVYDNEGVRYAEPEVKITGNEAIRSSTPEVCRGLIKETLKIMLRETEKESQKHITICDKKFKEFSVEEIAFPRSVNGLSKYSDRNLIYKKSTPIHVRASLLYNDKLKKMNLTKKYQTIKEGEKMKFVYLKEPNPIREDVIAFVDVLPKEFELENYIDYDKQFAKTFLDPITVIFDCIGWKPIEIQTLSEFFT
jgi:DNA polymerase elongation subunit (family B)